MFCGLDDKVGEEITKIDKIGRDNQFTKIRGSTKILKHTGRGSKLINLYVAFECASHMLACICISFKTFLCYLAFVVYAS